MFDTINVFLIEDEEIIVDLIDETLKRKPPGWQVDYNLRNVGSVAAAERYIGGGGWDVIILDLGLPDGQGGETYEQVQKMTNSPIIVFTGLPDYQQLLDLEARGAARCYAKPELANCMFMLHHIIRNIVREHRKDHWIYHLQGAMFNDLRNLIRECSNCHQWRNPVTDEFIPPKEYLEKYDIYITSGICPDCREELYGDILNE